MKIVIAGKGGSGKDYLKQKFVDKGFKPSLSHTTRPKREDEIEGISYNFISESKFSGLALSELFQETDKFNNWWYGTTWEEWKSSNIFIKTPAGVSKITPEDRKSCFIIYLDVGHNIRYERLTKRCDADSAERRIKADKKDFENFKDYDLRITNHDF